MTTCMEHKYTGTLNGVGCIVNFITIHLKTTKFGCPGPSNHIAMGYKLDTCITLLGDLTITWLPWCRVSSRQPYTATIISNYNVQYMALVAGYNYNLLGRVYFNS